MQENQIITTIAVFGFKQNVENKSVYSKTYDEIQYRISVDFAQNRIDYGPEIRKGDETTSHLGNPENIVVLECVDRLLKKGYKPADITLEKKWKLGRTAKSGKADITVKGKDEKTLLIIECKTWGDEYESELDRMKQNGGQLFSYFQQDKNTRYLCLYASRENNGKIGITNKLIKVEDSAQEKILQQETEKLITFGHAKTIKEMLDVWKYKTKGKQTFLTSGLFEPEIEPYNPGYVPIKISDLKDFGAEDKGRVFNQFEEILRHNNISDRSNAFNRIISLILSKIVDENKRGDAITDFQIKEGIDDAETVLERLQSLYSKAMRDYLGEEVIDYKLEDIEAQIANFPRQTAKDTLYRIYKELKFYQNNEFAFKEVYNKRLFEENAKVLEEVIRLFQGYRFKYDQKAQFLGDFFELMLETGYKQSEGQFFTPTPITKFIIYSIPLKSIVEEKLQKGEKQFLPKTIDFACGSGHFLTEAIEEIAEMIKALDESKIEDEKSASELRRYKSSMRWAGEYIFGIEKDYRLARTSQVACFMHGDGDANIIFGDGLEKHLGRLATKNRSGDGTFDVLIANPPYTIKDFKKHLNVNPHDFDLWEYVTPDSDDIEVFFIERMKLLLRPGGMAGIILPSSILSNTGPYTKAREIILQHFEIKAIVEFGGNTFGATSTNTVTLFLKRRDEDFITNCHYISEDFIYENIKRRGDFINSEELYDNYVTQLGLDMADYKTFTGRKPNKNITESDFYKNYQSWFDDLTEVKNLKKKKGFTDMDEAAQKAKIHSMFFDLILEMETEKFFYFLLTHRIEPDPEFFGWYDDETEDGLPMKIAYHIKKAVPQKTLIIKTGRTTKEQEKFLGYKFSNRRGYKGIDFSGETLMFDNANPNNSKKINSYVRRNFVDEEFEIDKDLAENMSLARLNDCLNYERIDFDKRISLSAESFTEIKNSFDTIYDKSLNSIASIQKGSSITQEQTQEGNIPVVAGGQDAAYYHNVANREPDVITISASGAYAGFVNFWNQKIFASDCTTVQSLNEKEISTKLIYLYLKSMQDEIYHLQRGQAQPHVYPKDIEKLKIPVPPIEVQKKIISEVEAIEKKEAETRRKIEEKLDSVTGIINKNTETKKLVDIADLSKGKTDPGDSPESYFNYLGLENLESGTGKILDWKPSLGAMIKSTKNSFKSGQVLYGKLRPYLNKVVIPDFDGVCSTDILVLDSKYPSLLQRILLSKKFVDEASQKMSGVNLPRIKVKDFMAMNIDYPKDPGKINEALNKIEKEILGLERLIVNVEDEKKRILRRHLEE